MVNDLNWSLVDKISLLLFGNLSCKILEWGLVRVYYGEQTTLGILRGRDLIQGVSCFEIIGRTVWSRL